MSKILSKIWTKIRLDVQMGIQMGIQKSEKNMLKHLWKCTTLPTKQTYFALIYVNINVIKFAISISYKAF